MKILIFSAFDGVPFTDEEPMRYAAIVEEFLKNGHDVTYVTASFSHLHKKFRTVINPPENLNIVLLPTRPYYNNLSIDRILSHYRLSFAMSDWLNKQGKFSFPDIVIGASPPVFANYVLASFCKKNNIPFIDDLQDLWPEEFVRFLPGKEKLKFILRPYFATAEKVISMASGITSVSQDYLDYYKTQLIDKPSKVFYLGTDVEKFVEVSKLIKAHNSDTKIMMIGNSQAGNFIMVAAKAIQNLPNVKLVIVGLREKTSYYQTLIDKENILNVQLIEWLDKETIYKTLPEYDLGLILVNLESKSAFPNRAFTYFSAGLPVISNIRNGEMENIIQSNNLGLSVNVEDDNNLLNAINYCLDNFSEDEHQRIQQFAKMNFSKNDIYQEYYSWVITNFGISKLCLIRI